MSELNKIALKILSNGKGILAADESNGTMTKRLESVNVPSSPENRLLFRETLFSSSGMKDFIGGVILYDETINQTSKLQKQTIPELISKSGAVPGIKVDTGAKILAGSHEGKNYRRTRWLKRKTTKTIISLEQDLQNGEVFIIFQINIQANYLFTLMLMH